MEFIFIYKFIHVLGASVLFGTGLGIAYFMLMAHRTGHAGVIAVIARFVVLADLIFTATAVVVQPVSGWLLAQSIGLSPLDESWIVVSLLLYVLVGLCWLPVVFIQMRMRKLAHEAAVDAKPLPDAYRRLIPHLVRARLAGLCGRAGYFRADDLAAALVVRARRHSGAERSEEPGIHNHGGTRQHAAQYGLTCGYRFRARRFAAPRNDDLIHPVSAN